MKTSDMIILALIFILCAGFILDTFFVSKISVWLNANLPTIAINLGAILSQIGFLTLPVLLLPIILVAYGHFKRFSKDITAGVNRFITATDKISITCADMARWAALAMVVTTVIIVIQRYVFGFSSTKLQESVIYYHAALFLLSSGVTLLYGGHVRVDIFYSKMSSIAKAWTDLIGVYFALFPMCILILVTSTPYVSGAWRILEHSREGDGLAFVFALKTLIPIFAVLMILQGLAMALRSSLVILGIKPPDVPHN